MCVATVVPGAMCVASSTGIEAAPSSTPCRSSMVATVSRTLRGLRARASWAWAAVEHANAVLKRVRSGRSPVQRQESLKTGLHSRHAMARARRGINGKS